MKCEQIRELLSPYIDQITDSNENNAIIAHLASCPDCREELKQLEAMQEMMNNLYTPQLPDTFTHDLRERLADEKLAIILKPTYMKKPKKAGWIAAAVAVMALGTGIFASTYLPTDQIIAYKDQQPEAQEKKTSMSVNDILSKIKIWDNGNQGNDNTQVDVASDPDVTQEPGKETGRPSPDDVKPGEETPEVLTEPAPEIKIADIYSAQIKVGSADQAVDKIIQIAQANQASYDLNATSDMVQAFSVGSSQMVEISATTEKVDGIIKELEAMGMVAAPMHDETVLTNDYAEALKQIQVINEKIAAAKADNDEVQLQELEQEISLWTSRKTVIDQATSQDTIRVYLVEEIKP